MHARRVRYIELVHLNLKWRLFNVPLYNLKYLLDCTTETQLCFFTWSVNLLIRSNVNSSIFQAPCCSIFPCLLPSLCTACVPPHPILCFWSFYRAVSHDCLAVGVWLLDSEECDGTVTGGAEMVEQGWGRRNKFLGVWIKKGEWWRQLEHMALHLCCWYRIALIPCLLCFGIQSDCHSF